MKIRYFCLISILLLLAGCSKSTGNTITRSNLAFDTVISVTLYNETDETILDRVFETVEEYDSKLNAFDPESEISLISTSDTQVSPEVFELIKENLKFAQISQGAFSPLLGNLIELWNINEPEIREAPDQETIDSLLEHTELESLILNEENNSVMISDVLTSINLGASSKGYVADQLKKQLINEGVESAIINLGGNILLIGSKGEEDFSIGIDNPDPESNSPLGVLRVSDKSIVTSGRYQRYFTDSNGTIYHHILDPETGYPAQSDLEEVVVVSDSSLEADMLSTTLFVMGKEKGIAFLREYFSDNSPGVIFVTEDTISVSFNLKNDFTLEPEYEGKYTVEYFDE